MHRHTLVYMHHKHTLIHIYTIFLKKIKLKVYTKWPGVGGEEVRVGILL